jgi:hypothetical protein
MASPKMVRLLPITALTPRALTAPAAAPADRTGDAAQTAEIAEMLK